MVPGGDVQFGSGRGSQQAVGQGGRCWSQQTGRYDQGACLHTQNSQTWTRIYAGMFAINPSIYVWIVCFVKIS